MMKSKFKKIALVLAGTLCLGSFPASAIATGWPVSDVGLLAYLSNSAAGGIVADNGGVISLLNQIESDLAHISSQNTSLAQNSDTADNLRAQRAMSNQLLLDRLPDNNACYAISAANSGGAASSSTNRSATSAGQSAMNTVLTAVSTGPEAKNKMFARAENGFCSDDDRTYNRGGCTSVGEYPKADVDAGALDGAPRTSTEIASGSPRRDYYTTDEAKKMNEGLVPNVTSNLGVKDIDDKSLANSTNGVLFGAQLSAYQAKSLLAQKANNDQIAMKTEINNGLTGEQQTIWNKNSSQWQNWFGFSNPKPTEWNLIKGQVYSRYADNDWLTSTATMPEEAASREMVRMQALALKMQLEQMKLQMTNNQLLSALLGNAIQPVTYDGLNGLRSKLESQ